MPEEEGLSAPHVSAIRELKAHAHVCMLYDSREEQLDVATEFLHAGLRRGERCVYVADANTVEQVFAAMRSRQVPVDEPLRRKALIVMGSQEAYTREGCFNPDKMIGFLRRAVAAAKEAGFTALRVTGEMSWALGGVRGAERLVEYEAKLNFFFPRYDCSAICQYDMARFSPQTLLEVIYTHPLIIYKKRVIRNDLFVAPEEFLGPRAQASIVERYLENILRRQEAEDKLAAKSRQA